MKSLSPWAQEAKTHLQKYRPKMASQLEQSGKLDDWAQNAANRAIEGQRRARTTEWTRSRRTGKRS